MKAAALGSLAALGGDRMSLSEPATAGPLRPGPRGPPAGGNFDSNFKLKVTVTVARAPNFKSS